MTVIVLELLLVSFPGCYDHVVKAALFLLPTTFTATFPLVSAVFCYRRWRVLCSGILVSIGNPGEKFSGLKSLKMGAVYAKGDYTAGHGEEATLQRPGFHWKILLYLPLLECTTNEINPNAYIWVHRFLQLLKPQTECV